MKRFLLVVCCCCSLLMAHGQVVSLSPAEVVKLRKLVKTDTAAAKHWAELMETANQALSAVPDPADTILSEGILQGDPRKVKTWNSLADVPKTYALGLAYKVEAKKNYLHKATAFLLAWAKHNRPMGNPINDTNLERIIFTYDLLKNDISEAEKAIINIWLNEVAQQELRTLNEALANKGSSKGYNNWNSHRIKILVQLGLALDNERLKQQAIEAYLVQISRNLKADGSSFDFHERDALHYHVYDVDPLLVAATVLNRDPKASNNYYTYESKEGASLKKGLHFLVPYFTGEKTHAEFVNSKAAFDKKRAANGEKAYIAGTLFKPSEARGSIALAAYFEPQLLETYQNQTKSRSRYPTWQFVLNEVKRD